MDEHILVCLSPSPTNAQIIEQAYKLKKAFQAKLTALYVNPGKISEQEEMRLKQNIQLAENYGAVIDVIEGGDVTLQIVEYAMLHAVTKIVIGKNTINSSLVAIENNLTERLLSSHMDIDIYIIPSRQVYNPLNMLRLFRHIPFKTADLVFCLTALAIATVIGLAFKRAGIHNSNVITLYILAVLLISIASSHWIYGMASSVFIVLFFNYLFIDPIFSFRAYDAGYLVTFGVMFISAMVSSSLASRLKVYATSSAQRAYRTKILFDTNKLLSQAVTTDDVLKTTASQLNKLIDCQVYYHSEGRMIPLFAENHDLQLNDDDALALAYSIAHQTSAGKATAHDPQANLRYYPLRTRNMMFGTLAIDMSRLVDNFEESVIVSIIDECALAIENKTIEKEKNLAEIAAENERVKANLLRTLSHDLRSPLTSISGHASNLLEMRITDEEVKKQIYQDIYDDSMWLIDTVENLLSITRIEEQRVNIHQNIELIEDVVSEALIHVDNNIVNYHLVTHFADEPLLCQMDEKLIVQVVVNLVNNAIKYTEPGSTITITTASDDQYVIVSVADNGPGIAHPEQIFEMFYRESEILDSQRSLGLGLYLCRMIITLHQGTIVYQPVDPHGSCFIFKLPQYHMTSLKENENG